MESKAATVSYEEERALGRDSGKQPLGFVLGEKREGCVHNFLGKDNTWETRTLKENYFSPHLREAGWWNPANVW
jgi:hypothetical protein